LRKPELLREMFIVPEEYNLPSIQLMDYVKVLKPFYPNFDEELMVNLLEMFDMKSLPNYPNINLGALSMGQKKKIYMCIALASRTKLLVMDEPTNGLDIPGKSQFREVVAQGMRDDQIVIISTHQVRDVETLLDHVTIIEQNAVLLNEKMNMDEPVNLEELFIDALNRYGVSQS
jgi:ABC-2 type transport system ATP-binding protein